MPFIKSNKDALLSLIRTGQELTLGQQLRLTFLLSLPAVLAQLSSIVMQYIDASMVGCLGADDSASIGLVSTTIWLFGGICSAAASGFAVQIAHLMGSSKMGDARNVARQAILVCTIFGLLMMSLGIMISDNLPHWLGGNENIVEKASQYFLVFSFCVPFMQLNFLAAAVLRCSGNIKISSTLNIMMCVLDVIFNFVFIFDSHTVNAGLFTIYVPGMGLGVVGAAWGTAVAEVITCCMMLLFLYYKSGEMAIGRFGGSYKPTVPTLKKALRIGLPMGLQNIVMNTAQIVSTTIVAPLGSVALAANSFAITAESLCYMPGYGIAEAATTLVGQSFGAKRKQLTISFAKISIGMGMAVMAVMGVVLYFGASIMLGIMTPVADVVSMGTEALQIEAFAEPLFGASIVAYGVCVGAGDTLVPCLMNFFSMWAVRLTLAASLAPTLGLKGVWTAMCVELCFRGCIYLYRIKSKKWLKKIG